MHGMIHRSIQTYLTDTFGRDIWLRIARNSRTGVTNYESMLRYPDQMAGMVLEAASEQLRRSRAMIFGGSGHTSDLESAKKPASGGLLRFGGANVFGNFFTLWMISPIGAGSRSTELIYPKSSCKSCHMIGF